MDLGDFFVQFMDLSEDEMKKNMDGILWTTAEILGCVTVKSRKFELLILRNI